MCITLALFIMENERCYNDWAMKYTVDLVISVCLNFCSVLQLVENNSHHDKS